MQTTRGSVETPPAIITGTLIRQAIRHVSHQTILILDFGSQFTQLIARRLRELSIYCEILPFHTPLETLEARRPAGVILSGGPKSVSEAGAPKCDPGVMSLDMPVLGICYGMQLMTDTLGGRVAPAAHREFGHAMVHVTDTEARLFKGLPDELRVWASHGDFVEAAPAGFEIVATSANAPVAAMQDTSRGLYGLLFHPEVAHTDRGLELLRHFAFDVCGCTGDWTMASFVDEATARIRSQVGDGRVVCGLSGGVDSTVAALLIHRAIGDRLTCIFVDNGLLRADEATQVQKRFRDKMRLPLEFVDAAGTFLTRLAGVTDPEQKRKIIGRTFIEVFDEKAVSLGHFDFLAQGTLYPDVIESVSVVGPSSAIKSHHNVGGLPEHMRFKLVEPLRELFKDEVRRLGRDLGLDEEFVDPAAVPGPGPGRPRAGRGDAAAARPAPQGRRDRRRRGAPGRMVRDLVAKLRRAAARAERRRDGRRAHLRSPRSPIRAVESRDGMTADWARLPHELLGHISSRIVNEVRGVNRVVYDISSKPPSTIEWE